MKTKKLTPVTTNNKLTEQAMKPAIIFGKNTAPTIEQIADTVNDPDYAMCFARLNVKGEGDNAEMITEVVSPCMFHANALRSVLATAADDRYRNVIESNPNNDAVDSVQGMRFAALDIVSDKFTTILHQNIVYCIADAVAMFVKVLESDSSVTTNLIGMIKDSFSIPCDSNDSKLSIGWNFGRRYANMNQVRMIGDAYNAGTDEAFNNATILIYNGIMSSAISDISGYAANAHDLACRILYSANSGIDVNTASNYLTFFDEVLNESISAIIGVIKENAYSLLNDIVLISATMYGNADMPNNNYEFSCITEF